VLAGGKIVVDDLADEVAGDVVGGHGFGLVSATAGMVKEVVQCASLIAPYTSG
jgi:hypothetical protein